MVLTSNTRKNGSKEDREGSWGIVEEKTGVERHWISNFVHSRISEPGFCKAYKLARYLGVQL